MRIKVTQPFNDQMDNSRFRNIGSEYEAPEERGRELISKGYAEEISNAEINNNAGGNTAWKKPKATESTT